MNIFTFPLNPLLEKGDLSLRYIKQLYGKLGGSSIFKSLTFVFVLITPLSATQSTP